MTDESMSYLEALTEIKRLKEALDKIRAGIEQKQVQKQIQRVQQELLQQKKLKKAKRLKTVEQGGTFEEKTDYGHIIDVSGNIGVTTTATMIREVLDLYDADFIKRWIMRFFHEYCVYVR